MKWIVPPVLKPLVPDIAKHSATTPWPANAASPWISSGSTLRALAASSELVLLGARLAEHDRVGGFEMRRVRRQRQMHLLAVELAVGRGAEVVFHVAGALHFGRVRAAALEFVEELAIGLAPSHWRARSAARDALMPSTISFTPSWPPRLMICSSAGIVDFAAVEAEALGAEEAHAGEFLEAFGFDQLVQDRALAFGREGDLLVGSFDAALQPVLLLGIVDVHELVADAPAIGALQDFDHAARRGAFRGPARRR